MKTPMPEPVSGQCKACNQVGALHCSDPMNCNGMQWHYTESQLRAAMVAAWNDAIEAAAKVCESTIPTAPTEFEAITAALMGVKVRKLKEAP